MSGAANGSADAICTVPREVGRRLQTLAVNALKACSGSPNLSSDSGCTWYSTSGRATDGSDLANAPNCEGAMLIGPLRLKAYCMPIMALPHQLAARVLSVGTPCTLITLRNCRWSCRFSPTPGSAWRTAMPSACSRCGCPMPASSSNCGKLIAPADSTTSSRAATA